MHFIWDTMTSINLILCIAIFIFGILGYRRSKSRVALFVGIAFGLFGISHLESLLGLKEVFSIVLIIIRTAAYLLVTYTLFLVAFRKNK